jgi:hypothetical protein
MGLERRYITEMAHKIDSLMTWNCIIPTGDTPPYESVMVRLAKPGRLYKAKACGPAFHGIVRHWLAMLR